MEEPQVICGIDFSSKAIDIVLLEEDTDRATWTRFPLVGQDAFERARDVPERMFGRTSVWWDDVMALGIEQPRGNHGVTPLMRIQGAILACLPSRLLVQPWNPSSWRKACGLPGNATKEAIMWKAVSFGFNSATGNGGKPVIGALPQDAFDAYCIAYATRAALERGSPLS